MNGDPTCASILPGGCDATTAADAAAPDPSIFGASSSPGAASQDVPPESGNAGSEKDSPGIFTLIFRTISGQGGGLFTCRADSLFCAGTGAQAAAAGKTSQVGPLSPTLFLIVAGLIAVLLILRRIG